MKNEFFPYPVLGDEEASRGFSTGYFECTPRLSVENGVLKFNPFDEIEITNKYIKDLYDEKKLKLACQIFCGPALYSQLINEGEIAEINASEVASKIEFKWYLIAATNIDNYCDKSFRSAFFLGPNKGVFSITAESIVGISEKHKAILAMDDLSSSKVFTIREDDSVSYITVDLKGDIIKIRYPSRDKEDYSKAMRKRSVSTIANLYIPALTKAFMVILDKIKQEEGDVTEIDFSLWETWLMVRTPSITSDWEDMEPVEEANILFEKIMNELGRLDEKDFAMTTILKELKK